MTGREPSSFFTMSWKYSAPGLILIIWLFTIIDYKTPSYGQYEYPDWCHIFGWFITLISLSALPILAIVQIAKTKPGANILQKFSHAWRSKIDHCPCCGAKLDESKRAHSDKSLTSLLDDTTEPEENLCLNNNQNSKHQIV